MRRKDKLVSDRLEIEKIISHASVCRLGLCYDNKPYIIPLNFGYNNNCLYFHSANEGKKLDILKINNRVCFEMDIDHELITADSACNWGFKYRSVIGFGLASIINDTIDKQKALFMIMKQYSDREHSFSNKNLNKTTIIKVEITEMTGKSSGY
jgi:nitroimidazol reductase NimA-like FMN-containing flavoprotein (pyridoxamine 5'-phosphate oxidase superfamily)